MPWFRFIDEANVTLQFRNGSANLHSATLGGRMDGPGSHRRDKPGPEIVLVRTGNMLGLRSVLRYDGFNVPASSPAERVMRAAVKCGYAEELPDDERWR